MTAMENTDLIATVAAAVEERISRNFTVIPTLTLDQAAEALGISNEKMRILCNSGEIPFIRMDRLYRIKPADINAYLERNSHPIKEK